jgi:hypothetical protein
VTRGAGSPTEDEVAPDAPLGSGGALAAGGAVDDGGAIALGAFDGTAVNDGGALGPLGGGAVGRGVVCEKAYALKNVIEPARRRGAWRMGTYRWQ